MNKDFINLDGKAIINDDSGHHRQIEYFNGLENMLEQENLVEEISDRILELEDITKAHPVKKFVPVTTIIGTGAMALVAIGTNSILKDSEALNKVITTVFGNMRLGDYITICGGAIFITAVMIIGITEYSKYRSELKTRYGNKAELSYLKKRLIEEERMLNNYKKEHDGAINVPRVKIGDASIEQLDIDTDKMYEIGSNLEKYYKKFKKGKLERKLNKMFELDKDIKYASEFVEKEGSRLLKK